MAEEMMRNDIERLVSDLLISWHHWSQRSRFGKGYPSQSASCKPSKASRQYDDVNGALDTDLESSRMEAFDAALYRIDQPHRCALQNHARNMVTGAAVWSSYYLPTDVVKRHELLLEARNMLAKELAKDGLG